MLGKFLIGARIGSSAPSAPTIQTYSTPGTYSWTAPAGVTNVTRLRARGGSGSVGWSNQGLYGGQISSVLNCTDPVYGSTLDYSVPYNQGLDAIARINTITTNPEGETINPGVNGVRFRIYRWCNTTSNWRVATGTAFTDVWRRVGTATLINSSPTSGTVPINTNVNYTNSSGSLQRRTNNSGGASTALGKIFYGGSGTTAAVEQTHFNTAVVPGTTYSFTVGNNLTLATSFIEIEY